jgi:hypothetical protein
MKRTLSEEIPEAQTKDKGGVNPARKRQGSAALEEEDRISVCVVEKKKKPLKAKHRRKMDNFLSSSFSFSTTLFGLFASFLPSLLFLSLSLLFVVGIFSSDFLGLSFEWHHFLLLKFPLGSNRVLRLQWS